MRVREIPGPAGPLEALMEEPPLERGVNAEGLVERGQADGLHAAVVIGHPHPQFGGTMHTKAVFQAAKAFSRIGCAVLRFNFRGVGTSAGSFADGAGERDDFRAALDFMHAGYPGVPLWAGGMSFGAWIALTVGAADPRVSTLVGICPPLSRLRLRTRPREREAEVLHPGRARRSVSPQGDAGVLRQRGGPEGARGHRRGRSSVRRQTRRGRRGYRGPAGRLA